MDLRHQYWLGGTISQFSPNAKIPPDIRSARLRYRLLPDTCFHCSYCFDTLKSVHRKLSSFAHTELDTDKYHDEKFLIDRYQNGLNLFGRLNEGFIHVDTNKIDLPRLLKLQPNRFKYILNRASLPNAGFRDA